MSDRLEYGLFMEDEIVWKIASLETGCFLFWFVETKEDRRSVMIPYLIQGVERGEKLLVFGTKAFFQSSLVEEIRSRLDDVGLPATGQLNAFIVNETDSASREARSPDDLAALIREELDRGLEEGYPAVRVLIEMNAIAQKWQSLPHLLDFEREMETLFAQSQHQGLMVLDAEHLDLGALAGLLVSQKRVGIRGDLYRNDQAGDLAKLQTRADLTLAVLRRAENQLAQPRSTLIPRNGARRSAGQPVVDDAIGYQAAMNAFPGLMAFLNLDGTVTAINPAGIEIARIKPSDLNVRPIWEAAGWEAGSRAWLKEAVSQAACGEIRRGEICGRGKQKEVPRWTAALSPVLDGDGQLGLILFTARDRTALDALNRRVEERDDLVGAAAAVAPLFLMWIDLNGLIRFSMGTLGCPEEKKASRPATGRSIYSVAGDIPEFQRDFARALQGESVTTRLEVEGVVYEARYEPARDGGGKQSGVVISGLDISQQVWLEDALYRSEERTMNTLSETLVGVHWLDLSTRESKMNPALERILGYTASELPDMDWLKLAHPEDVGRATDQIHALETGEINPYRDELRLIRRDGSWIWVRLAYTRHPGSHGEAPFTVGIFEEVTQKKLDEDLLRRRGALLDSVIQRVPIGIWITDEAGAVIAGNPTAEEIWGGMKPANLAELTQVPATFIADGRAIEPQEWAVNRVLQAGETVLGEMIEILPPDGQRRQVVHSAIPIFDPNQQLLAAIAVSQDVTEQKQVEKELAEVQRQLLVRSEAERLSLAQELHDGPIQDLYGITFQLHDLGEALAPTELEPVAKSIIESLQGVISVLRTMCTNMRPPTLAPFGLEKAIRSHAESFQRRHASLKVHLDLTPDGQTLPEDVRLGLFRIYQELLNNVIRHAEASRVDVHFHLFENQAELIVEDNGRGFEVPRRWVEIVRQGHYGLVGLQERAEALGGSVKIVSAVGQGTCIKIGIPRIAAGGNLPAAAVPKPTDGE
jgi:PAS domain S-box-containing protein